MATIGADNFVALGNTSIIAKSIADSNYKNVIEISCDGEGEVDSAGIKYAIPAESFEKNKVYVLQISTKAIEKTCKFDIVIKEKYGRTFRAGTYYSQGQWVEIAIPFIATGNETDVEIHCGYNACKILVTNITYKTTDKELKDAKAGYFMVDTDEWEHIQIPVKDKITEKTSWDVKAANGYIYSVSDSGVLYILNPQTDAVINQLVGFGNLRQMAITDDEKTMVVVAREDAAYIFDLTEPLNPVLTSKIDSIELASGLDVQTDKNGYTYCYIADRFGGADIINITDKYNPIFVSNIDVGECQNVTIYNGYMYVGLWGERSVKIFDVRDAGSPRYVSSVELSGRGDGVLVRNNILYAATGHFKSGLSNRTDADYATGNGLDIFDVSVPSTPIWISTTKLDGRMYVGGVPDVWRVKKSGDYLYLSSTINGLYVFNVKNPYLPIRVSHIDVVKNEPVSKTIMDTWVYPFDITTETHYSILSCEVYNGKLYISGTEYGELAEPGLYVISGKKYILNSIDNNDSTTFPEAMNESLYFKNDFSSLGLKGQKFYQLEGCQIWATAHYGEYTYVAAGTGGIRILDKDLNEASTYPTLDITMDIQIYDNMIVTAECSGGMQIYTIDKNNATKIMKHGNCMGTIRQIQISPDGKFVLVQFGVVSALIDIHNIDKPILYKKFNHTMVYHRQLSAGAVANRYLYVFANEFKTVEIDFGSNGRYDIPIIDETWVSGLEQMYGLAADGDYLVSTAKNKLYRFSPNDIDKSKTIAQSGFISYDIESEFGYPTVIGDYLFISSRISKSFEIYKLGDRTMPPVLLKKWIGRGTPELVTAMGKTVYIPLGYGGLLRFEI